MMDYLEKQELTFVAVVKALLWKPASHKECLGLRPGSASCFPLSADMYPRSSRTWLKDLGPISHVGNLDMVLGFGLAQPLAVAGS